MTNEALDWEIDIYNNTSMWLIWEGCNMRLWIIWQLINAMDGGIRIGGEKGHIEEVVQDPIFIAIYTYFRWKKIPNCTGRYTCRDHKAVSHLTPIQLLGHKDPIYVIPFTSDGTTGLISYVKNQDDEGLSYVHTLNSASGFKRKLEAINVTLSAAYLVGRRERWTLLESLFTQNEDSHFPLAVDVNATYLIVVRPLSNLALSWTVTRDFTSATGHQMFSLHKFFTMLAHSQFR